ncbi:MAG: glycerol-3-phosphate 1-O-acyltransferase PlsY [Gemmataceae bacterium]|nr:glycerol-3-phosphate 1-O-acyltransferase PlsY [Gemmataceae bacterium]
MELLPSAVWIVSYFVGAVPFGYLVARARGVDIFAHGSGNIGATNVGRVVGRKFGMLVFVLDFLKGVGPTAVAMSLRGRLADDSWAANGWLEVGAAVAAFLGHCFPIYLGFRGGKGVATGAGTVAVLFPEATAAAIMAWFVVAQATRFVSLASIVAVLVLFAVHVMQAGLDPANPRTLYVAVGGAFVIVRHRSNVRRIWLGTENRFQENGLMESLARSIHVLAVGLWFGMAAFFSFAVATGLFDSFEQLGRAEDRPSWFPRPEMYSRSEPTLDSPKEQGSRAAGYVIGPLFTKYYLWQGICGILAVGTAIGWAKRGKLHAWRANLLVVALILVLAGWPLERKVGDLRVPRNEATEAYLKADAATAPSLAPAMKEKRDEFLHWHLASVFLNLGVIVLVGVATAMAGHLPPRDANGNASRAVLG